MPAQAIVRNLGGTIDIVLRARPDAAPAPTVTLRGPNAAIYVDAQTATPDAVNTTLSAAAAAAATTVSVASTTGITVGRIYLLGGGATAPRDQVRVRGVTGTTVTLARPLRYAQANATGFVGTRMSYPVTAAQATVFFFDGHAEWSWSSDGATLNEVDYTAAECVRRRLVRLATWQDLATRDPKIGRKVEGESDPDELLDVAWNDLLERLGGRFRVRTFIGSDGLVRPTVYRALSLLATRYGLEYAPLREHYEKEYEAAISQIVAQYPCDTDQDGFIEPNERGFQSLRVDRA